MPILAQFLNKKWRNIGFVLVLSSFIGLIILYYMSTFKLSEIRLLRENNECSIDPLLSSLCSCKADNRGLHQNVVAYSLYGPFDTNPYHFAKYYSSMQANVERIQNVYKGWNVRIYVKSSYSQDLLVRLMENAFQSYPHVDICNATKALESRGFNLNIDPTTWRFLPLLDPTVDSMMSRDTDSVVTDREVDAVNEWIKSGATFHIMRDSIHHCVHILGGMWGANVHNRRDDIVKAGGRLFNDTQFDDPESNTLKGLVKGFDQLLLTDHIWPLALNDSITHDSNCGKLFKYKGIRPFPTHPEQRIV